MLKLILLPIRFILLLIIAIIAAILSMTLFYITPPKLWHKVIVFFAKIILAIVGVKTHTIGRQEMNYAPNNTMVIANHMSWLDTIVMLSIYGVSFVGKIEMTKWPVINHLVRACGTIFIDRNNKRDILAANKQLNQALNNGQCVGFFPEGKVNNGTELLSFKSSLFEVAMQAKVNIIPIILVYHYRNGQFASDLLYAGNNLFQTIINTLRRSGDITAEINILPTTECNNYPSRHELAIDLHSKMESVYTQKIKSH